MSWMFDRSAEPVPEDEAPKGDSHPVLEGPKSHAVLGMLITNPWEDGQKVIYIGIGYYQGAEKLLWGTPDVLSTSVESAGDVTPNPAYRESCTRRTNHVEVMEIVYDPEQISFDQLIVGTFGAHDPTQDYRQDNDVGTQYRSAVYTTAPEQTRRAQEIVDAYASKLADAGLGAITTEIKPLSETPVGGYHRTEDEHQQYLFENPNGYCPVYSTGVTCGI